MADVGRPTKLTPELQERVIEFLRMGAYIETAAAAVGVNKSTLHDWLRRGASEPGSIYEEFSAAVETAMAKAELRDLERIEGAAAAGIWQAAAWRLERKFPARWGRKDRHELTGPDGGPIKTEHVTVLEVERAAREAIEDAGAEPPSEAF